MGYFVIMLVLLILTRNITFGEGLTAHAITDP